MLAMKLCEMSKRLMVGVYRRLCLCGLYLVSLCVGQEFVRGEDEVQERDVVVARLGKQEILWSELVYRWRLGGVNVVGIQEVEPLVLVEGVEAVRRQRIAQAELDRRGKGVLANEVEQWINARIQGIEAADVTAADLARAEGLRLGSWQAELRWQKSWERYTRESITDEKLKLHYETHQEWFDGTEREVFHILRPLKWSDRSGRDKALSEFAEVLKQIRAKQITFEEAAKKWSSGATAAEGGRLGWLSYQGPMHPNFIRAAFGLWENELSEPIETPHGVHLIWVRAVKRGELPLERVSENVRRSLLMIEFEKLVSAYPKSPQLEWVHDVESAR